MAKIQDKSKSYSFWKHYVDFMFRQAYRRVEYCGKKNIPQDGAIIYAPNHSNTLMDALAVLAIDSNPKVFVARADVFKNPIVLKILTFCKMLPINRRRDGADSLSKNEAINNMAVDVLHDKVPFCILPEGTHRPKHSLMPLQKGIFRIALQANETFGKEMPVYIVPVGIEFGHFFRYRSSLLVQIGKPINVTQFLKAHSNLTEPQQINELRNTLSDEIKKVMLQIPDDENYDATLQLVQIGANEEQQKMNLKENSLKNRFKASKEIIKNMETQHNISVLRNADNFFQNRHALGIGTESILNRHLGWSVFGKLILLLAGLPYFVFSAAATAPVTLLSAWLCSKFKDRAFHNTVRFLLSLVLLPLLLLIGTGIIAVFAWQWAAVFFLLFSFSFFFLHDYLRLIRLFMSDIKWLIHKKLRIKLKKLNQL